MNLAFSAPVLRASVVSLSANTVRPPSTKAGSVMKSLSMNANTAWATFAGLPSRLTSGLDRLAFRLGRVLAITSFADAVPRLRDACPGSTTDVVSAIGIAAAAEQGK